MFYVWNVVYGSKSIDERIQQWPTGGGSKYTQ